MVYSFLLETALHINTSVFPLLMAGPSPDSVEGAQGGAGGGLMSLLPFLVVILIFYFLIIRPSAKKRKENKTIATTQEHRQEEETQERVDSLEKKISRLQAKINKIESQTPSALPSSMDAAFTKIVKRINSERGFSVFEDFSKSKSLLQDYTAGEYKKESRLLLLAIEAGCPSEIVRSTEPEITKKKLVNKLHNEFSIETSAAEQIVALLYEVYKGETG